MNHLALGQRLLNQFSRATVAVMNLPVPTTTPTLSESEREELDQLLQPGDIILQSDNRYPGWQISQRLLFGSQYSHAALYSGRGQIIDADSGAGVTEHGLEDLLEGHRFAVVRPAYQGSEDREAALGYARRAVGKPFDDKLDSQDENELYCSELIDRALQSMPHPIAVPCRTVLGRCIIVPDELANLPNSTVVWSNGGSFAESMLSHWPQAAAAVAGAVLGGVAGGPVVCLAGLLGGFSAGVLGGHIADHLTHLE